MISVARLLWRYAIILPIITGGVVAQDNHAIVNMMLDYDIPSHPTSEQLDEAHKLLVPMTNELSKRGVNFTLFATAEVTTSMERLYIGFLGRTSPNMELAIYGNTTGERLSRMPLSKQKELLEQDKAWADALHYCGINTMDVRGFKPQLFDQNADTYKVLDEMGMIYDAGFKAGILSLPGHDRDIWPYPADGHKFYAVPISTCNLSGERACLVDKYIRDEKKLSGSRWYDTLVDKFDEASDNGEPMVVAFSTSISGSGDYFEAFIEFLDYGMSKEASFISTRELIDIAKARSPESSPVK